MATKHWAALGDFNQILNPAENSKGNPRIIRGMQDFRECIDNTGLFDIIIRGNLFTWWNRQEESPQGKKLDRVLINGNWQLTFSFAFSHFGDQDFTDHSPTSIVLGT